jgi:tRNA 2-thiouridine synthesizing protein E
MFISVAGKSIALDRDGHLKQLQDWNREVAQALADNEGILLTDAHWAIIDLLRAFYKQFEISPAMRPLIKYVGQELGREQANSIYLLKLFPGSPARIAAKLAGLPKPDNCL